MDKHQSATPSEIFWSQIKYAFSKRWSIIALAFIVSAYIAYIGLFSTQIDAWLKDIWDNKLSAIVGLSTLFVAVLVWWGEVREDRRESLPKRLTIIFQYKGNEVMRCEKAHLFSDADIRQLGQQVGMQMAGVRFLDFIAPHIRWNKRYQEIILEPDTFTIHHEIIFDLIELPKKESTTEERNENTGLREGDCRIWREPFANEEGKPTWFWKSEQVS